VSVPDGSSTMSFWTTGNCSGAYEETEAGVRACLTASSLSLCVVGGFEMGLEGTAGAEGVATGAGGVEEDAGPGLPEPEPEEEELEEQREEAS